jgi:hypothetical protein
MRNRIINQTRLDPRGLSLAASTATALLLLLISVHELARGDSDPRSVQQLRAAQLLRRAIDPYRIELHLSSKSGVAVASVLTYISI